MTIHIYGIDDVVKNATQQRAIYFAAYLTTLRIDVQLHIDESPGNRKLIEDLNLEPIAHFHPKANPILECVRKNSNIIRHSNAVHYVVGNGIRSLILANPFSKSIIVDLDELAFTHDRLSMGRRLYHLAIDSITVFTNSQYAVAGKAYRDFFLQLFPNKQAVYTPNGYDSRVVAQPKQPTLEEKKPHEFLYIGTISYTYQIADLIKVAKILQDKNIQAIITICGDGIDKTAFLSEIKRRDLAGYFSLEGHIPIARLGEFLRRADAYLFPIKNSLQNWTRCPVKIYYYAAFGKPVVTEKVGEVVQWLSETSIWYDSEDPKTLEFAIEQLISRLVSEKPRQARPKDCSWETQMKIYWSELPLEQPELLEVN